MRFVHVLLLGSMVVNVGLLVLLQTSVGGGDAGQGAHASGAHHPSHSLRAPPQPVPAPYKPRLLPAGQGAAATPVSVTTPPALRVQAPAVAPSAPVAATPAAAVSTPSAGAAEAPAWARTPPALAPAATRTLATAVQPLVNPLLRHLGGHNADSLWDQLLKTHPEPREAFVVEVGAHDGNQALDAGKMGFQVITYEPSPQSAKGIRRNFAKHGNPQNVKLIEAAATNFTGDIMMNAVGSTGDHIGVNTGEINKAYLTNKHTKVSAVQVDDLVLSLAKGVYMVKIDVQGHEVLVLEGMRKALEQRRVLYVMLEFWPRAIKTTSQRTGHEALALLASYGYQIYDTKVHHRRGQKDPPGARRGTQLRSDFFRATHLKTASGWYEEMDALYGDTFGCKTDMLAVAPVTDEQLNNF